MHSLYNHAPALQGARRVRLGHGGTTQRLREVAIKKRKYNNARSQRKIPSYARPSTWDAAFKTSRDRERAYRAHNQSMYAPAHFALKTGIAIIGGQLKQAYPLNGVLWLRSRVS